VARHFYHHAGWAQLFESEFVESQEAVGVKVIGTFTDLDRPDRFVWLRGFKDMDSRLSGLTAFYDGPVWKKNREAANATMVDSDNVLLLRAPAAGTEFALPDHRPTPAHLADNSDVSRPGERPRLDARTDFRMEKLAGAPIWSCTSRMKRKSSPRAF